MLIRGEALILNFGQGEGRLMEGDVCFRAGTNSRIYGILFYLKIKDLSNDIMKSNVTERIKQHAGVNYHNFRKNILKHGKRLVIQSIITSVCVDVSSFFQVKCPFKGICSHFGLQ